MSGDDRYKNIKTTADPDIPNQRWNIYNYSKCNIWKSSFPANNQISQQITEEEKELPDLPDLSVQA